MMYENYASDIHTKYDKAMAIKPASRSTSLLIVVALVALFGAFRPAIAQSQDLVTNVDCETAFPECKIYLAPWRTGGGLTSDKLAVRIDGQPQALNGLTQEIVGVQVAFALDEFVVPVGQPGYSIRTPGASGQPKFVEFRSSAIDFFLFLERNSYLESAWLSAFRTGEPSTDSTLITSFPPIADWVSGGQINVFYNELIDYEPAADKNTPETPLYDLISATLAAVQQAPAPDAMAKHVVVFTDGFERIETLGLDLLLRQAQEGGIRIHTVMLGPGDQDLERILQKVSQPTGGSFVRYTSVQDLQTLWAQIGSDANQNVISLTLPSVDAQQLQVSFNGQTVDKALSLPQFDPPTVTISEPTPGELVERRGADANTPLDQAEPLELPIVIDLVYPNQDANLDNIEINERIEYVEYSLGELTVKQQQPPFAQIFFPIAELGSGPYTLQVRVKDRFSGLTEPVLQPIQIAVVGPESPSATLDEPESRGESTDRTTINNTATNSTSTDGATTRGASGSVGNGISVGGAASNAEGSAADTTDGSEPVDGGPVDGGPVDGESIADTATNSGDAEQDDTGAPNSTIANPADSFSPELRERAAALWATIGEATGGWGSQLTSLYQTQPRYLMVPVIVTLLLLLFGLQIKSVRSSRKPIARQNFATSDPPNNDITEPEDATEPANEAFPIATLVFMRGEGELPKEIPLHRQHLGSLQPNQWSLGRSYQESDEVIESRRISRLHATITEQHGRFLIRDEGSSGGTYITSGKTKIRRRLEALEPASLEDNDTINFNSIAYRFEVDRSEFYEAVTEPDFGDETEPELSIDALL